ncbi:unnamed protein product [Paramecium primaurelia]|uniref:Uncharacterized protein n=1 Tax=Paramecium primaurelia TaxID=5886 RepID=A0A8S1KFA1_PARPR|nr:unnamed protein product [Paramecium primaurelia]
MEDRYIYDETKESFIKKDHMDVESILYINPLIQLLIYQMNNPFNHYHCYKYLVFSYGIKMKNNHNAKYKRYLLKSLYIKEKHKSNVIFCGSEIIQLKGNTKYPSYINNDENLSECLGLVLRTGFSTAKGKFMKTMLYNNQDVNRKQIGELFIALFLLIFASIANAYIIINWFQEDSRNKYYLFIRCLLIITTVVPFLLPMMLSITVQHDNNKTYILEFFDNNYVFVEYGTNNKTVLNNVEQEIKLFQ